MGAKIREPLSTSELTSNAKMAVKVRFLEIVLDRSRIRRYFWVTSDVRPLWRVLTEREEQTMGHDNLAMNDAGRSMMVSWDAFITRA
jgi:hypothetical protein